jgi:SAM-dependent methyltransferase
MTAGSLLETEEVFCSLCDSRISIELYHLTDTAYFVPGEFILRRCAACGLMYLSPRPTPAAITQYYPANYSPFRRPVEDERWRLMRWMRRRKLSRRRQLIERYLGRPRGRVLDVGAATGLFLHEMALGGWETAGVELVESAAQAARKRFGLEIFQGTLAEAPYGPEMFDTVTFWDVLEHTYSPKQELIHAARLLRPNGIVALSVPNWDSFDRGLFGRHWQGLDSPRHLYVFSRPTLTRLLHEAGFGELYWICFMPGYFAFLASLQRWLNSLSPALARPVLRFLSIPGIRLPFEPWFAVMNGLRRGPVISVFARKQAGRKPTGG